jgi:hypothetical protein
MKRFCIPVAALAMMVGCQDNNGDTAAPKSSTSAGDKTQAEKTAKGDSMTAKSAAAGAGAAAKPIEYQEVPVGDKLYIVGSKEAAEKAKAGKLEKPVRAVGIGPENVKVYFEEANQTALEAEYARRHPSR